MAAIRLRSASRKPDLSEWTLESLDKISDLILAAAKRAATEAIELAMEDEETDADLAAAWSDARGRGDGRSVGREHPVTVDPLAVYLTIAVGDDADSHPIYVFDIRQTLMPRIGDCRADGSFAPGLRRIMDAMRELADEIESALPTK